MSARSDLLRELAASINPIAFAKSCGIDPDEWQRDLLLSTERQILLNCARQSGKSEIVSILALFHAMNNADSMILVLSPSLRQSGELFKKIVNHYRDTGRPMGATIESALTLQLGNRSRIVSLPATEKTIRGYSGVSLLLIDEAARVPDELYIAVRPMLAVSQGRLIALSTPAGKRGFFYDEWMNGEPSEWLKIAIKATQCPRISREFLRSERRALGERWFSQEYCTEFHESEAGLFRLDIIEENILDFKEYDFDLDSDMSQDIDLTPPIVDESEDKPDFEIVERELPKGRLAPRPLDYFAKGDF